MGRKPGEPSVFVGVNIPTPQHEDIIMIRTVLEEEMGLKLSLSEVVRMLVKDGIDSWRARRDSLEGLGQKKGS